MRLNFLLALAVLVLPLSGCAKKNADPNAVASNDSSDNMNSDSEGMDEGMSEEGMDEGLSEEGMEDGMDEGLSEDGMSEDAIEAPGDGSEGMDEGMSEEDPMSDIDMALEGEGSGDGSEDMPDTDMMPEGDPMSEGMPEGDLAADGMGTEGGRFGGGGVPTKPTDVPNVKKDTPEYAAVDFILKVTRGDTKSMKSLIAEDVDGLLKKLRSDEEAEAEAAIKEAKELIGRVKPQNSRLGDRDTIVSFKNDNDKILQFYVRRIQGEYVVREMRVRDAVNRRR